jgi:hypothetical protein
MSNTNPVMQRVEQLDELWEQFAAHPAARLACWQLDQDSSRMFDLFLELQPEEASEIPDLFIRCPEPMVDVERYGMTVRESIVAQYDEVRESLQAEGIAANWQCPSPRRNEDDVDALLAACVSLQKAHESILRHVVIALLPHAVPDVLSWRAWLQKLLTRTIPEHVRFLVVDQAASPELVDLCPAEPERVMALRPELGMGTAYLELLRQVPGSGPAYLFRRYFVALGNAVGAGNVDLARRLADHAGRIAAQQQWPSLHSAVALLLGGAYMARQDYKAALDCYRQGRQVVTQATDEVSKKVALQASFAEASALLAAQRHGEAAQVYEQILAASQPLKDGFARLEGARMAAYCHELAGNREAAWARGLDALAAGEALGPSAQQSTMRFSGQSLLRLAAGRPPDEVDALRGRLDRLLGAKWQDSSPQEAAL